MTLLNELKPTKKLLVMHLLEKAGVDVSDWQNYKGASPTANPRYCYNWSFEQPGELVAVCLWHRDLKPQGNTIVHASKRRSRGSTGKSSASGVWNMRSAQFDNHLELAYRQQLPVRVIVVDGVQRNRKDVRPKASVVEARLLDPVSWAVAEYDFSTGQSLLVRGAMPVIPAVTSADLELSWFEGAWKRAFVFHRSREASARRAKIHEAMCLNSGRLICEVPNCGFDFRQRYGSLGEGYVQVHHLAPLSKSPRDGRKVKLKDLALVCANCHVMIHMGGKCRPLTELIPTLTD
jgi:5-methylcytosine-specific restriction enzyme A